MEPVRGYCVVCKATRDVHEIKQIDRAGGPAIEGACTVCGHKIFVLGAQAPETNAVESPDS